MSVRRVRDILLILGISVIVFIVVYIAVQQVLEWRRAVAAIPEVDKRIQTENEAYRTLAQLLGATFFLITAYFTWQMVRASERNVAVSLEGQITDRFTKAIEQLGDTTNLAKRLGGIYVLERIAKDSPKDHWTIMEVLTAYVRENAPWKEERGQLPLAFTDAKHQPMRPPTDIQAILTVLGRRTLRYEKEEHHLDLHGTDLRGADLSGAHLEGADLSGAHLEGADLGRAQLRGADLSGAHLERAFLGEAQLERAYLREAQLEGADLGRAQLRGADLREAQLKGAHLWEAQLERAHLREAQLEGAFLGSAQLEGAFLGSAQLEGADLRDVVALTPAQLQQAVIDATTQLPGYLKRPSEQQAVGQPAEADAAGEQEC
jgi:uncharacterized protein YjbI with pentapeptide repeats